MPKTLSNKLKKAAKKIKEPVWKGPEVDGVTQSLLSRYLVCKERFRILVMEGWAAHEGFSAPLHYGEMWHLCEELHAMEEDWEPRLLQYCMDLCKEFRSDRTQIDKWFHVCKRQFPHYVAWWKKQNGRKKKPTPLLQEEVFDVPYELPSGRYVRLRGKWDSVHQDRKGVWLQENKTKGRIEENYITRQLNFDLQTMIYLVALREFQKQDDRIPYVAKVKGVRYNVVRRPLSGGKGSIRKHKATKTKPEETDESFYNRLEQYFIDDPSYWFMRWDVEITEVDVQNFKDQFLDPCLEHLCLWYDYQVSETGHAELYNESPPNHNFLHYRLPYGIFNPIMEGRGSDIEEYLLSGSTVGLKRVKTLFGELENA